MDYENGLDIVEMMNPQKKQALALQTLLDSKCKYLLYGGAMAGGKSYLLRWAALFYLLELYAQTGIKNIPVGLFSEDYPTLKDRQIARIKREFPKELGELKESKDEGYAFFVHEEYGGGRIMLRNLDDPSKYMSSEFAGIFVEELTRNPEQTFEDLRNRLRYPGIEDVKFMGATNPGGVGHGWVRKLFIDQNTTDPEQEKFYYIHANAYDNEYISPTYLKQLESLPEQKRKAYLEGSWDVFAGQVYSEFNREIHVVEPFIPNKNKFDMIIGGLDWGRVNPTAIEITGIQKKELDGVVFYRAYTFLEVYGSERTPKEWGERLMSALSQYNLTLDDIRYIKADTQIFNKALDKGKAIVDQFADADPRFRYKLQRADKERIAGWENLHNWLSLAPDGLPYWVIARNCTNLIRTLPELVYDDAVGKMEDVDATGEAHAPDATRYMFKSIKWIDAKVGGVGRTKGRMLQKPTARMKDGRQLGLDLTKFEDVWWKKVGKYQKNPRIPDLDTQLDDTI